MEEKKTEQELFWKGSFGDDYTERNQIDPRIRAPFLEKVLSKTEGVNSICEFGANKGHNLQALKTLKDPYRLTGVEINHGACGEMRKIPDIQVIHESIHTYQTEETFDFVMVLGMLIHLDPESLTDVYRKLLKFSKKYVLIVEYFNPSPVALEYRTHQNKMFKRDFGGEFWDAAEEGVELVDYGFLWKRVEPTWDDVTWWLFAKKG